MNNVIKYIKVMTNKNQIASDVKHSSSTSTLAHETRKNRQGFFLIIVCCALMAVFCGCQKDTDGTFARMNINEAKSLFIASSGSGSKIYGVKKSSLKSTSSMDDEIYEIGFFDKSGKQIIKENPRHIFDAGNFIIVCFGGNNQENYPEEAYFVNKSNGLIYAIPQDKLPVIYSYEHIFAGLPEMFMKRLNKVQLDKYGNVYYVGGSPGIINTLYKVSPLTSSVINITQFCVVNDDVRFFCVDYEGNILYRAIKNSYEWVHRYRKAADGSFVNYEIDLQMMYNDIGHQVWTGTDGVMYEINIEMPMNNRVFIMKMQDGKSNVIIEDLVDENVCRLSGFYVQGRIILVLYNCIGTNNYLMDVSSESSYKKVSCSLQPNMVVDDKLCYFDNDTYSCTLIDIDTGQTSLLYSFDKSKLGNYDVDKVMSVTESGIVFSAAQLSDGKYVVAKLDTNGTITIQQIIEGTVSVVLPLNL